AGQVLVHGKTNTSWDVATRLMQFLSADIDVLNMSFGCLIDTAAPLPLRRALDRLSARTVLVAAAGNHALRDVAADPVYPAAFGDVVAVGAADDAGHPASTTPSVPWLDLLAPGENLTGPFLPGVVTFDDNNGATSDFGSGYAAWSGSSFAAANV